MEDCKVLVIEDDGIALTRLAREIKKEGFCVVTAENGRIGVELLEKECPQIVLSDLKMPEMSGMEVLKKVKQVSPSTLFILMSSYGDMDTVIEAFREGAFDYIKKPIDLDLLTQILKRAKEEVI
jgi:two-component system response regulator AtoC